MDKHTSVSKAKKKPERVIKNNRQEINPNEIVKESTNPFDFGGLPIQNFKKNLGCG